MEGFGDPRLVNRELLPAPDEERWLRRWHLAAIWGAVVITPGVYAFAITDRPSVGGALVALAVGTTTVAAIGWVLSRAAVRYGVSFAIVCRAAFGARGAWVPLLLRWIVGVAWLAGWALAIAVWSRRLLIVALEAWGVAWGVESRFVSTALMWHLPYRGGVAVASWVFCLLLLVLAWLIARQGLRAVAIGAAIGLPAAGVGAAALVIYGGIRSAGFGEWMTHGSDTGVVGIGEIGVATLAAIGLLLPAVISCSDWMRWRRRKGAGSGAGATPWVMVPVAVVLAFFGALIASAALVVLGRFEGSPIADATSFGHLWAGGGAVLLTLAMWITAAPLVGLYSPGLAFAALLPRRLRYRSGTLATAVASVLAVPLVGYAEANALSLGLIFELLIAPVGVLLADQLIVRRGNLVIEEVYLYRSEHGPLVGFKLSALVAVAVGWSFLPSVWSAVAPRLGIDGLVAVDGTVSGIQVLVGGVIAAVLYAFLAPLEIGVARGVGKVVVKAKKSIDQRRSEVRAARWVGHKSDQVQDRTNPYFVYGDSEEAAEADAHPARDDDEDDDGTAGGEIPQR